MHPLYTFITIFTPTRMYTPYTMYYIQPYIHLTHLYPPSHDTPDICPKHTPLHDRYYHHRKSGIVSWELPNNDGGGIDIVAPPAMPGPPPGGAPPEVHRPPSL